MLCYRTILWYLKMPPKSWHKMALCPLDNGVSHKWEPWGNNYAKKSKQAILKNSFSSFEWRNSRVYQKHKAGTHKKIHKGALGHKGA